MKEFTIEVEARTQLGSSANRAVRRNGFIPAVLYARGVESTPVTLSEKDFVHLAKKSGVSQVFSLKSALPALNGKPAIVKEIQRDYVKGKVLHVDLQVLREDEEISIRVRLEFTGEAPGVKVGGGILTISAHDIGVRCLPKHIPQTITVDVSALEIGQSIHFREVTLPSEVKLLDNADESVVSVILQKAIEETPVVAAGAVTAEGAAVPADGAAPASGAEGAAAPAADAKGAKEKKEKK